MSHILTCLHTYYIAAIHIVHVKKYIKRSYLMERQIKKKIMRFSYNCLQFTHIYLNIDVTYCRNVVMYVLQPKSCQKYMVQMFQSKCIILPVLAIPYHDSSTT